MNSQKEDDRFLVLQTENVDFQIEPKKRNPGIFSLYRNENQIFFFEWIPDPKRDQESLKQRNIPSKVKILFQQVSKIERLKDTFNTTILCFTLDDQSRLPLFIFRNFAYIFVSHFLEFLVFKKVLRTSSKRSTHYHVIKTTRNFNEATDIIDDTETNLSPEEVIHLHSHNQILSSLGYRSQAQVSKETKDRMSVTISDMNCNDFSVIKHLIFHQGIAEESRPFIWPILFGVLPYSADVESYTDHLKHITNEYLNIMTQYQQLTADQIQECHHIQETKRIISNDVHRNDRKDEAFKGDDNPNLILLKNVLTAYSIFNRDTGYVQGMNDLVTPFILMFLIKWTPDGQAVFYDGSTKTCEEAEAFIFWSFVGMMELTQHERLFTDLAAHQEFVLQRVYAIATRFHEPLKDLLEHSPELKSLSFLFKPMILIFKRAFKTADLYRLWDSVFTAESPPCFSRFIAAAVLILLYPKLLLLSTNTLGEVMCLTDGFMNEVDIDSIINLASILMKKTAAVHSLQSFVFESIPDRNDYRKFSPKYFKLK